MIGRVLVLSTGFVLALPAVAYAVPGDTLRVSEVTPRFEPALASDDPAVSADGRFVAFSSAAYNLVPGDTNRRRDVFVRDLGTGAIELVSVSSSGVQADDDSTDPSLSADGRYVAFQSAARNLVPDDRNKVLDVFVHDRLTGLTERVSVSKVETQASDISYDAQVSATGRYVAFTSRGAELVWGDSNGTLDVFVRDRVLGTTERVSLDENDEQLTGLSVDPSISADGQRVAFATFVGDVGQGNLEVQVRDRPAGTTTLVSADRRGRPSGATSRNPQISADGSAIAFSSQASTLVRGDTNGAEDVFVRILSAGVTERVGTQVGGLLYDDVLAISATGRFVGFPSAADDLVPGDTNGADDVFVTDRSTGRTERVSVRSAGGQSDDDSFDVALSADGRRVAFASEATNLVDGDTNGLPDVFVHVLD